MKKTALLAAITTLLFAAPLVAQQESELADECARIARDFTTSPEADRVCRIVAQGAHSAQPHLGILLTTGNPTLGTAGTGGLRLGAIPRVNATVRLNASFVRVPDIFMEQGAIADLATAAGIPIPAVSGDLTVGVFPGFDVSPFIRGVGAVDLLGSVTWLPFAAVASDAFGGDNPDFGFGWGGRLGLLRESAITPAISLTAARHSLGESQFGNVCPGGFEPDGETICLGEGDVGEFAFDLTTWSTRAMISKRLLGLGATIGIGRDSNSSDVAFAFRDPQTEGRIHRGAGAVSEARTIVFGNLSYTILIGTLALEGGWVTGGEAIEGFDAQANDFDPAERAYFAGLGLRIAF